MKHVNWVCTISQAGHHATERYGVQALGEKIRRELGVEVCFFDDNNPA